MDRAHLLIKMYQSVERLTVAAAMPGLEPGDISVRVTTDGRLELRGKQRGPRQHAMDLLIDEWSVGPYERTLVLPCAVDGSLADVTFGNGVLVVALPKATQTRAADMTLEPIGHGRGQRVGSHGKGVTPTTTAAHRDAQAHNVGTADAR
jgi:HSP20 family protein